MTTNNNTTGRALWRTGLRAVALAFGALGWVLSTLYANDKRQHDDVEDLPRVDVSLGDMGDPRYDEDGYRLL